MNNTTTKVYALDEDGNEVGDPVQCQWFALCDHDATQLEPHPILGQVPICDRCKAKVDSL